jgi:hypothetical protein
VKINVHLGGALWEKDKGGRGCCHPLSSGNDFARSHTLILTRYTPTPPLQTG